MFPELRAAPPVGLGGAVLRAGHRAVLQPAVLGARQDAARAQAM